jgi:hypothetical protein
MTVAVTFYAGLVPRIITGALTNIIMPRVFVLFGPPGSYLFVLCNIAVAFGIRGIRDSGAALGIA